MHLSTRNKIFIAGIIGAVTLIVVFGLLMVNFDEGQRALDLQFPGRETDGVPEVFYIAYMGVVCLAISGFISGVGYTALDRAAEMKPAIAGSVASGAATGLLIFLAACVVTVVNASSAGLAEAAVALFMGAFYMAPFFVAILFLMAAFGALGGIVAKLAMMGINKIRNGGA